jgi:photosystem II stability/assembly factor-like uncharacterized protein
MYALRSRGLLWVSALLPVLAFTTFAQTTWTRRATFPIYMDLRAVAFASPTHGVLVADDNSLGHDSLVLETTDGGVSWVVRPEINPFFDNGFDDFILNDVYFADTQHGWLVGNSAASNLRTVDGGVTWLPMSGLGGSRHVDFVSPQIGWVGTNSGTYRTTNGGSTWTFQNDASGNIFGMDFWDANLGLAAGIGPSGIKRTVNGGQSWANVYTAGVVNDVKFMDGNVALAAASSGVLLRSTNAGLTWTPVSVPNIPGAQFRQVFPRSASSVYALTWQQSILASEDAGLTWTVRNPLTIFNPQDVAFAGDAIVTVGTEGMILRSTDQGATWPVITSGAGLPQHDIGWFDNQTGIVAMGGSICMRTTDGGQTWKPQRTGGLGGSEDLVIINATTGVMMDTPLRFTYDRGATWNAVGASIGSAYGIEFVDPLTGWYVSSLPARIFKTVNGAVTWQMQYERLGAAIHAIDFVDSQHGWAAGEVSLGGVLRSDDGGATWHSVPHPQPIHLYDIEFFDPQHGWAVGNYGYIVRSDDGGLSWREQSTPTTFEFDDCTAISVLSADEAWVAVDTGFVLHTINAGATWERESTGVEDDPIHQFVGLFGIERAPGGSLWAVGNQGAIVQRTVAARRGDVDGDGDVDLSDLSLLLVSFGLCSDDAGFDANADFDASGCVDLGDLAVLLGNFGL